ncbi:MAG: GyrI-like domain-containing protein [Saprospiraceae bacterium]|nr:GyrI-like domain-containing protein [Saprospiraceae bacterium]MCB9320384.1 GyrI-like domain-containing protein [Lewinellaceae bacterium]
MEKVDLKKKYAEFYAPGKGKFEIVEVPDLPYLIVYGQGNPNTSPEYIQAIEALYSVAYTLKFAVKKGPLAIDYGVMPLEGQWWMDDMNEFTVANKDHWKWAMMILQPDCITAEMVDEAIAAAGKRKDLPALSKLHFGHIEDGLAAQTLYIGPYADEGPTIQALHEFIFRQGFRLHSRHREIYLGDPRRSAPEKLKTIIRQPMIKP